MERVAFRFRGTETQQAEVDYSFGKISFAEFVAILKKEITS